MAIVIDGPISLSVDCEADDDHDDDRDDQRENQPLVVPQVLPPHSLRVRLPAPALVLLAIVGSQEHNPIQKEPTSSHDAAETMSPGGSAVATVR